MTPMHREKQWDMFDVATGACTLEDYLFQRYSENDLASTFWIDAKDEVDELRPPKPTPDGQPGTEPEIIPLQGPRADKKKAEEAAAAAAVEPTPVPVASPPTGQAEVPQPTSEPPVTADGQDTRASSASAPEVPSLESFKSGGISPQPPAQETYQPQPKAPASPAPSLERVELSGETGSAPPEPTPTVDGPQTPEAPKVPSMEELLARFHQATMEHKERIFTEDEASGGEAPSEGSEAGPSSGS